MYAHAEGESTAESVGRGVGGSAGRKGAGEEQRVIWSALPARAWLVVTRLALITTRPRPPSLSLGLPFTLTRHTLLSLTPAAAIRCPLPTLTCLRNTPVT